MAAARSTPDSYRTATPCLFVAARRADPVADRFYGDRLGAIEDPFGHRWSIVTRIEDASAEEIVRRGQAAMQAPG